MKNKHVFIPTLIFAVLCGGLVWTAIHKGVPHGVNVPAAPVSPLAPRVSKESEIIRHLVDPRKLDDLTGDRAANRKLRQITYWLEIARRSEQEPDEVLRHAQEAAGYLGTSRADADRNSLLRNRKILESLGCLNEIGMDKLRHGLAPTISLGPYAGDIATVDHILPLSVVPELDNSLLNLEFMPSRMNKSKGAKIGERQVDLARIWSQSGILSDSGLEAILSHSSEGP